MSNPRQFEQGTPEWLEYRRDKVTASEVPMILGVSPYMTRHALFEQKINGTSQKENPAMAWGTRNEGPARDRYILATGEYVTPAVVVHKEYPWMMASLDGLSMNGKIACEIKTVGLAAYIKVCDGVIPPHHYQQCQAQMECLDIDSMDYVADTGDVQAIVKVFREEGWRGLNFPILLEFKNLLSNSTPPPLSYKDFVERHDDAWHQAMQEYICTCNRIKELEKIRDEYKESLIKLSHGQSAKGSGGTLQKIVRKGNIDYAKIDALKGVDLEQYRKKDSEFWTIRLDGE